MNAEPLCAAPRKKKPIDVRLTEALRAFNTELGLSACPLVLGGALTGAHAVLRADGFAVVSRDSRYQLMLRVRELTRLYTARKALTPSNTEPCRAAA